MLIAQQTFLIEEYSALRAELDSILKDLRSLSRYSILGTGAVWAWIISNRNVTHTNVLRFLPSVLVLIGYLYSLWQIRGVLKVGAYLNRIEMQFELPPGYGWETERLKTKRASAEMRLTHAYWLALFLINFIEAFFL